MNMGTTKRPGRVRGEAKTLLIGALSRAAHIPVETLRTWERLSGNLG